MITGDHVRMIRGAMRLSVRQFAEMAGISKMTVSEMERGLRRSYEATTDKIRAAFSPYVEFIEPVEGVCGAGIIMKWGAEPFGEASGSDADQAADKSAGGLHSLAWDEDFCDAEPDAEAALAITDEIRAEMRIYLATANISPRGKAVIARSMRL